MAVMMVEMTVVQTVAMLAALMVSSSVVLMADCLAAS